MPSIIRGDDPWISSRRQLCHAVGKRHAVPAYSLEIPTMTLHEIRTLALRLPAVSEQPHHQSTSFRVEGKIFATAPPDGDYVHLFVSEEVREAAIAVHPAFAEKLFWGGKVRGLRVRLAEADPAVVAHWLRLAWKDKAAKALHAKTPPASA